MIQSISAGRAAAVSAESAPPVQARAAHGGQPGKSRQQTDSAAHGFGERMRVAASETGHPAERPAGFAQDMLLPPSPERGEVAQPGGRSASADETSQALTPEQWLLGMIDQQLAEIQARDATEPDVVSGPVAQPLPEAVAPLGDEWLAWLPAQLPAGEPPLDVAPADPLDGLMAGGYPGWAADANPAAAAMPRSAGMSPGLQAAAPALADALPMATLEPLQSAPEVLEAGEPVTTGAERGQLSPLQAADRALKLQAPDAKWGEQMLHALRENVDLQIQQKIQSATIRLDPPELGSLEILLSHESGRLNVQLSAANADVARLLQQTSDRLRQELVGQHFVQVNVQVGADGGGQQGQQRQRAAPTDEPSPLAARPQEPAPEQDRKSGRARDVLITV